MNWLPQWLRRTPAAPPILQDEARKVAKQFLSVMVQHEVSGALDQQYRELKMQWPPPKLDAVAADVIKLKDVSARLVIENGQLLTLLCDMCRALGLEPQLDENGYTGMLQRVKSGRVVPRCKKEQKKA